MQTLHTTNYSQLQLLGIHNKCLIAKIVCCEQCPLSCRIGTTVYSPLWLGYWAVTLKSSGPLGWELLLLSRKVRPLLMPTYTRGLASNVIGITRPYRLWMAPIARCLPLVPCYITAICSQNCKPPKNHHSVQGSERRPVTKRCLPCFGPGTFTYADPCTAWVPEPLGHFTSSTSGWWHSCSDHVSCSGTSWVSWTS